MVSQSETPPTGQGGISTKKLVFLPVELRNRTLRRICRWNYLRKRLGKAKYANDNKGFIKKAHVVIALQLSFLRHGKFKP